MGAGFPPLFLLKGFETMKFVRVVSVLCVFFATPALAQSPSSTLHWTPRLGVHVVDNRDLVWLGDEWGGADGSATAGLTLDVATGLRWLSLRGSVDRTVASELVKDVYVGEESCGRNCSSSVTREEPIGDLSMWVFGADLLIHPFPSSWRIRPFAVAGTGLKHYRMNDEEVREREPQAAGLFDTKDAAHHVGIGFDAMLMGQAVRLEATDYVSVRRLSFLAPDLDGENVPRTSEGLQHDLVVTVGVRMPLP